MDDETEDKYNAKTPIRAGITRHLLLLTTGKPQRKEAYEQQHGQDKPDG